MADEIESLQKQLQENEDWLDELNGDLEADGDDSFWFWSIKMKIWKAEKVRDDLQNKLDKIYSEKELKDKEKKD